MYMYIYTCIYMYIHNILERINDKQSTCIYVEIYVYTTSFRE